MVSTENPAAAPPLPCRDCRNPTTSRSDGLPVCRGCGSHPCLRLKDLGLKVKIDGPLCIVGERWVLDPDGTARRDYSQAMVVSDVRVVVCSDNEEGS